MPLWARQNIGIVAALGAVPFILGGSFLITAQHWPMDKTLLAVMLLGASLAVPIVIVIYHWGDL